MHSHLAMVLLFALCLLGACLCLSYVLVSLWRDRPRALAIVAPDAFDDNAKTTIAHRKRTPPRGVLVTLQEAKTRVRHVIAYRPTRLR